MSPPRPEFTPSRETGLMYDHAQGSYLRAALVEERRGRGLRHVATDDWECDVTPTDFGPLTRDPDESEAGPGHAAALYRIAAGALGGRTPAREGALVLLELGYGTCTATVAATSLGKAEAAMKMAREFCPPADREDPDLVHVSFWAYGPSGPEQMIRRLHAPRWDDIRENYPLECRRQLERLMDDGFAPGRGGQLVLWHGNPGTGKTTALRALAQAWRGWARLHYITDPEHFFGEHSNYMLRVMLEAGEVPGPPTIRAKGEPPDEDDDPWRVLLLEDSGELLQRDARQETGQALSRFLNAVDGLIGQGLRVLTLVTTNEEVRSWHPAVTRHGRTLAQVEFPEFSADESSRWLRERGAEAAPLTCTLADLYAKLEEREDGRPHKRPVGFAAESEPLPDAAEVMGG